MKDTSTAQSQEVRQYFNDHVEPVYDHELSMGDLIERSLNNWLSSALNKSIPSNAAVLELGCGTGYLSNFLAVAGRFVLAVDFAIRRLEAAEAFRRANRRAAPVFLEADLLRAPVRHASFDVVICDNVLQHMANPAAAFSAATVFVKRGGYIVLTLDSAFAMFPIWAIRTLSRMPRRSGAVLGYTMDQVLQWFAKDDVEFVSSSPATEVGADESFDYRRSLFDARPRGSRIDRIAAQVHATSIGKPATLVMVGRKR